MVGLETGALMIWKLTDETKTWTKLIDVADNFTHTLSVRRIRFNSRFSEPDANRYTVATCANDQTVRIFRVTL